MSPPFQAQLVFFLLITTYNSLLCLASALPTPTSSPSRSTNASLEVSARQKASKLSPAEVDRLDRMFKGSSEVAINGLYELNILKHLSHHFRDRLQNGAITAADSLERLETDPGKITVHLDAKNGDPARQYAIHTEKRQELIPATTNGTGPVVGEENYKQEGGEPKIKTTRLDESILKLLHIVDPTGAQSEARQAGGLFSGFRLPTTPALPSAMTSNPLMSGFLRPPSLPAFPQFPVGGGGGGGGGFASPFSFPQPAPPPRPPKTSIIGGGSGPMALTNDNVVVVNVLSGNY